jgi:hypothetical protein
LGRQDARLRNQDDMFAPRVADRGELIVNIREFYAWLTFGVGLHGVLEHQRDEDKDNKNCGQQQPTLPGRTATWPTGAAVSRILKGFSSKEHKPASYHIGAFFLAKSRKAKSPSKLGLLVCNCCSSYFAATHVVLLLSYLKPGAALSASLVVSIVR